MSELQSYACVSRYSNGFEKKKNQDFDQIVKFTVVQCTTWVIYFPEAVDSGKHKDTIFACFHGLAKSGDEVVVRKVTNCFCSQESLLSLRTANSEYVIPVDRFLHVNKWI